jgi:hypothetical protein
MTACIDSKGSDDVEDDDPAKPILTTNAATGVDMVHEFKRGPEEHEAGIY